MGRKRKYGVGYTAEHDTFGEYSVVDYVSDVDVTIKFKGTGFSYHTSIGCLKKNNVVDRYYPSLYGVGYIGCTFGSLPKDKGGYYCWSNMISRCYNPEDNMYSCYGAVGATVCDSWHNLQNFLIFYGENLPETEGFQLDKDVLSEGNKVYSPETCVFIPYILNAQFKSKVGGGSLPRGVYLNKKTLKYEANLQVERKHIRLGSFSTQEEASTCYRVAKKAYVDKLASSLLNKGLISERVFVAVLNHTFKEETI